MMQVESAAAAATADTQNVTAHQQVAAPSEPDVANGDIGQTEVTKGN